MAGSNSKLSVTDGCTEPTQRRKNARKQAQTRQQLFKKGGDGTCESSTYGALLLEKVLCGL